MTSCQDMYGAQYGNNPPPDEARQRARPMTGFEDPSRGQGGQGEFNSPCPGPWQWACDNMQCIAQYDLCNGVEQCMDGSDERNCRGRYPPQYPSNPQPPPPSTPRPSTTTPPKPESDLHPFKLILAGAGAFIIVVGIAHLLMKRRQQLRGAVRNYRKGQSLVDDEDDLLINQMYS